MTRISIAAAALVLTAACAFAQTSQPQPPGDAKKDLTNCAPPNATVGGASTEGQAIEKSAILPSAGNHENSAAPTVQRDGKSVEAQAACPQDPAQPKPNG